MGHTGHQIGDILSRRKGFVSAEELVIKTGAAKKTVLNYLNTGRDMDKWLPNNRAVAVFIDGDSGTRSYALCSKSAKRTPGRKCTILKKKGTILRADEYRVEFSS